MSLSKRIFKVRLDVGFKLFHRVYYKEISGDYLVVKTDILMFVNIGYFKRYTALKIARQLISNDSRKSNDDEISAFRSGNKTTFVFLYKCNYEYDEYDESSAAVIIKKIKFKKL